MALPIILHIWRLTLKYRKNLNITRDAIVEIDLCRATITIYVCKKCTTELQLEQRSLFMFGKPVLLIFWRTSTNLHNWKKLVYCLKIVKICLPNGFRYPCNQFAIPCLLAQFLVFPEFNITKSYSLCSVHKLCWTWDEMFQNLKYMTELASSVHKTWWCNFPSTI